MRTFQAWGVETSRGKIATEKGSCLLDYRNESNGYYGGILEWPPEKASYFYGGVYGQNVSNEVWRQIA